MKSLQGHMLHGHMLEIKISSSAESGKKPTSSSGHGKNKKLMIRNVPFEASRGELLQLFGSFGQLKSVRLPKKFDGGHRGFAFVEFLSTDEARAAMDSLLGTHLYGRHLVVEWADDKDDVETLRQKAQEQQEAILTSKVAVSKNKSKTFR
jgi:multiple RNA-binding domain-containing protein 1